MPCVQVVHIVCHTLVAHVDLKPTLCKLIDLPLEVIYLLVAQIFLDQRQDHFQGGRRMLEPVLLVVLQ